MILCLCCVCLPIIYCNRTKLGCGEEGKHDSGRPLAVSSGAPESEDELETKAEEEPEDEQPEPIHPGPPVGVNSADVHGQFQHMNHGFVPPQPHYGFPNGENGAPQVYGQPQIYPNQIVP